MAQETSGVKKSAISVEIKVSDTLVSVQNISLTFVGLQNKRAIVQQKVQTNTKGFFTTDRTDQMTHFIVFSEALGFSSDTIAINSLNYTVTVKNNGIRLNEVDIWSTIPDVVDRPFKKEYIVKDLNNNKSTVVKSFIEEIPEITSENGNFVAYGNKKIVFFLNGIRSTESVILKLSLALIKKVEIISNPTILRTNELNTISLNVITKKSLDGTIGASSSVSGAILNPLAGVSFDPYYAKKDLLLTLSFNTYYNKSKNTSLATWKTNHQTSLDSLEETTKSKGVGKPLFLSSFLQKNLSKNITLSASLDYNTTYQNIDRNLSNISIRKTTPSSFQDEFVSVERRGNDFYATSELFFEGKKDKTYLNLLYASSILRNNIIDSIYSNKTLYKSLSNDLHNDSKEYGAQVSSEHTYSEKVSQRLAVSYNVRDINSESIISEFIPNTSVTTNEQPSKYLEKTLGFSGSLSLNLAFATITAAARVDLSSNYDKGTQYLNSAIYSPQLYFYKTTKKGGTFNFSAYKTVSVPNQVQVSAGNILYSQYNLIYGNTQLGKESTYKVDLTHDLILFPKASKISWRSNIYYTNTQGLISNDGYKYDNSANTFFSRSRNLGEEEVFSFYSGITKKIKKIGYYKLSGTVRFNRYDFVDSVQTNNTVYGFSSTLSLNVLKKVTAKLNVYYNNYSISPYSVNKLHPSASLTFSGQLVKNKLFIEADWSNLFNWNGVSNSTYNSYYVNRTTRRNQFSQNISFSLTWIIGKKLTKETSSNQSVEKQEVKTESLLNRL
ncbi:MAG: outer membrane beta-barrel protein [Bacteroidota bacterium]